MANTTPSTGIKTSFTNTPQANDDSYVYDEDSLLLQTEIYNDATGILSLNVMSNDLGGAAKTLFSVSDGDGNPLTSDFSLLSKDTQTAGPSAWERTADGNWIRINNGKIDFALGTASDVSGPSGISINSLAAGATVDDTFVVSIRLANGALSQANVSIRINGNNDAAAITASSDSDYNVTEAGGVANGTPGDISASGQLTVVDLDTGESGFQAVEASSLIGSYGSFTFDADTGEWHYTLDNTNPAVEALNTGSVPLTDSLTVTSLDGTASQTIEVTINGSNDAPVISGTASGATREDTTLSATGTLTSTDVDTGATATWTIEGSASGTYGSLALDGNTGQWTYTLTNGTNGSASATQSLAEGESHDETFTVRVTDEHGAFDDQIVTVTVTGTNDIPVITGETTGDRSVKEDSDLGATGTLGIDDADAGQSEFTAGAGATTYGNYSLSSSGVWSYTLNNTNTTVQALGAGVQISDSFVAMSQDGTASKTVTITITGTADGPAAAPAVYNGVDPKDFDTEGDGAVAILVVPNNPVLGSDNNIRGTDGDESISSGGGNDTIYGYGGDDTLSAGNDTDAIYGGSGNDSIDGGPGTDEIYGGSGNDVIVGGQGIDSIYGGSGNDSIAGNAQGDVIIGGFGADVLTGNSGIDVFTYLDIRDTGDTITDFSGVSGDGDKIDLSWIDANPSIGGDDAFVFAGQTTTLSANSLIWFISDNGTEGNLADDFRVIQVDTDGDIGTAEMEIHLAGVTPLVAGDFVF